MRSKRAAAAAPVTAANAPVAALNADASLAPPIATSALLEGPAESADVDVALWRSERLLEELQRCGLFDDFEVSASAQISPQDDAPSEYEDPASPDSWPTQETVRVPVELLEFLQEALEEARNSKLDRACHFDFNKDRSELSTRSPSSASLCSSSSFPASPSDASAGISAEDKAELLAELREALVASLPSSRTGVAASPPTLPTKPIAVPVQCRMAQVHSMHLHTMPRVLALPAVQRAVGSTVLSIAAQRNIVLRSKANSVAATRIHQYLKLRRSIAI